MLQDVANARVCNVCVAMQNARAFRHNKEEKEEYSNLLKHIPGLPEVMTCQGCRLVAYCSTAHQKLDWPLHKQFCRAVQATFGHVAHPFAVDGEIRTLIQLERTTLHVKLMLRTRLKRPLRFEEEEWTTYPAYCAVCYALKRLRSCTNCRAVCWCSDAHAQLDAQRHGRECGLLSIYYCAYKALPQPQQFNCAFAKPFDLQKLRLIDAFRYATAGSLPARPTATLEHYQQFATAAGYSCIATICYALSVHYGRQKTKLMTSMPFNIFVVGATIERDLWFKACHMQFFFLNFSHVTETNLYFIGPEARHATEEIECFEYKNLKRRVTYISYSGTFQAFRSEFANLQPNLNVAFNCGFSEYAQDSCFDRSGTPDCWPAGIHELVQIYSVPLVLTSFSKVEARQDYDALLSVVERKKLCLSLTHLVPIIKNPHCDFRPLRSPRCTDTVACYYRNGYLQVLLSRGEQLRS